MKLRDIVKNVLCWKFIHSRSHTNAEYDYLKKRVGLLERQLEEKSHCVEKAKSYFLKNLYHEIRTPLNSIVGFSDLIELNNISEKEKDSYVSHIRESSKNFLSKMDNIIEASIIEAGILNLAEDDCPLYEICAEIHAYYSIQKHIKDKSIALLLSVPDEKKDLAIRCDAYRLSQILTNLLSNAFKFTDHGVIEYGFTIQKNYVEFFVKDTGIGGLDGKENIIFENFTKLDETDNSPSGLGLGLRLSKRLVELMGGRIWYQPGKSTGTTFYFTLPYHPVKTKSRNSKQTSEGKVVMPNFKQVVRRSVIF